MCYWGLELAMAPRPLAFDQTPVVSSSRPLSNALLVPPDPVASKTSTKTALSCRNGTEAS